MAGQLFFVCSTDHLETVLRNRVGPAAYFLSSLGNSLEFTADVTRWLVDLIYREDIARLTFVLSTNNKIIDDALTGGRFRGVDGMRPFYAGIRSVTRREGCSTGDRNLAITQAILRQRVKALREALPPELSHRVNITHLLYNAYYDILLDPEAVAPPAAELCAN